MGFEGKPDKIKTALEHNDTEHLQAAGRKGAEVTNAQKKRERERAEIAGLQAEVEAERRALEDVEMRAHIDEIESDED